MSCEALVEERFVHALGQACNDPDDQESAVVYVIATHLSFAAPVNLSKESAVLRGSRHEAYHATRRA